MPQTNTRRVQDSAQLGEKGDPLETVQKKEL